VAAGASAAVQADGAGAGGHVTGGGVEGVGGVGARHAFAGGGGVGGDGGRQALAGFFFMVALASST